MHKFYRYLKKRRVLEIRVQFYLSRFTKAYTKLEANVKLQDCHKIEMKECP
jgi:hypothetical protein